MSERAVGTVPDLRTRLMGAAVWSTDVAKGLTASPGDLRHLGPWLRAMRASPLDGAVPWWPYSVVEEVGAMLGPSSRVFEYGSGGSTLWLEPRVGYLRSIEHDRNWYGQVARRTATGAVTLIEATSTGTISTRVETGFFDDYVSSIESEAPASLDLVIVDGRCRVACVEAARTRVRPGGVLLLDDSSRGRYAGVADLLDGWSRRDAHGLKPGGAAHSTLWTAPQQATGAEEVIPEGASSSVDRAAEPMDGP